MEMVVSPNEGRESTELGADALRLAHRVASRSRALEAQIIRMAMRGDVKFAIWGTGEEIHGTATALALSRATNPDHFGIAPHYRSGSLVAMWCELNNYPSYTQDLLRQQFSKATDRMSQGRQMVQHLVIPEVNVLPVQSPVGMQLGKAAGFALGYKKRGIHDSVVVAVIGDGSCAEGDMHDTMHAISVWQLPLIILVTDNNIAISTPPEAGRGIKHFDKYAEAFGVRHMACDGRDFFDTYRTTLEAARYVRVQQAPLMLHVHSLPRFNGHSSAADMTFDMSQEDPLIAFGQHLVNRGVLSPEDILKRTPSPGARDFFILHDLGKIMDDENEQITELLKQVRAEPDPDPKSLEEHVYAPFPKVEESRPAPGRTNVTYGAAIRSALDHIISKRGGVVWGQDVARLGGVMQATAGLMERYPEKVFDAPLNEPLIVGTAMGAGLHKEICALPEIQFGDYSLNAFHWLVYLGNLYWTSNGHSASQVILRMPVDPFGGGAVYHSMSVDGYFAAIPGLVLVMPSTSWDVYGLLMTASEYQGPVVFLEPKALYRQSQGPAFPGEPTTKEGIQELKKKSMRGYIPPLPEALRVPFSKGIVRRAGSDLTIVSWGRAVMTSMSAATALAAEGIEAEVIDLRTLVPPDLDLIYESVGRTGRLIVAAEDRPFAGFARTIQGHVTERFPGMPTKALGQKNLPAIAQCLQLEEAAVLSKADIVEGSREILKVESKGAGEWLWVPSRYYIG